MGLSLHFITRVFGKNPSGTKSVALREGELEEPYSPTMKNDRKNNSVSKKQNAVNEKYQKESRA